MTPGGFDGGETPRAGASSTAFACTLLQERFWLQHKAGATAGLNIAMRWLVEGRLSHAAAEGALQALVQRHEILRTRFEEIDGALAQVVLPDCPLKLRAVDLSGMEPGEADARADEIARTEALEPFDPRRAPLFRATLLSLAPDRAMLLLTFHAMIVDGWSTGLIIREFSSAAAAIEAGGTPDAPEPDLQFADYALWEKELVASGALDESRTYWARQLRDAEGTELPSETAAPDGAPASRPGLQSQIISLLVPDTLGRAIDAYARRQNVTLFSLATAALAAMLHRRTGAAEIVIGSQVANREAAEAADLVGPTVNSITLRLPIDESAPADTFVRGVSDVVLEALEHQRLPFEIAEKFAAQRDGRPLHAINLVVHKSYSGTTLAAEETPAPFSLLSLPSYPAGTPWPLNFFMIGRDEGWRMSCEFDTALFAPAAAQRLLDEWLACLESLVTAPDARIADFAAAPSGHVLTPAATANAKAAIARDNVAIPVHDPARQVVRFHEHASKTPFVVLNNVSVYYPLARQLGDLRPFIDIQLYHPTGPIDLPPCDFEVFGAYALRLVRWAQPKGPYMLGGHCVYGVLALEVARQLRRAGETVDVVALFDSWAPGYREDMSPRDQRLRQRRINFHARLEKVGRVRRGELGLKEITWKPLLRRLRLLAPDPPPPPAEGAWFDLALRAAAARYRPAPYDGDVVLFRSLEVLRGRFFDDHMGWRPLISGKLTKVDVDSGHSDMFREQPAGEIATVLRGVLSSKDSR